MATQCSVDGCNETVKAKGYCRTHYTRWRRHGDPTVVLRGAEAPEQKFRRCAECGEAKPVDEFGGGSVKSRGGKSSYCRPCNAKRIREWRVANPERNLAIQRRHNERRAPERPWVRAARSYGLTVELYGEMLAAQGGGCAICGTITPNGRGKRFHVDHDHSCCPRVGPSGSSVTCGRCVRGLLCHNCNTLIGLAKEDPERLLAAARYLQKAARRKE